MGDSSQSGSGGGNRPTDPRRPQSDRPANPFSSDRSISYEPEVRDWSDLPRVGLPLVGLLSLVGLLWYWLAAVIGGGVDMPPTSTPLPPPPTEIVTAIPPSPTVELTTGQVDPTPGPEQTPTPDAPPPTLETFGPGPTDPPTPPAADVRQTIPEVVILRSEPSTTSALVEQIPPSSQITVVGPPVPPSSAEDDPDLNWLPVTNEASGKQGFIRSDLLVPQ